MSSYNSLGPTGTNLISEQLYKSLFGYSDGKNNLALSSEVPGNSRLNIFQNQLLSSSVPTTSPSSDLGATGPLYVGTGASSTGPVGYKQVSNSYPYMAYYSNLVLDSSNLTPNQTFWYIGANTAYSSTQILQVTNNLLTQTIVAQELLLTDQEQTNILEKFSNK